MWKKDEEQTLRPVGAAAASPEAVRAPAARSTTHATIGPSIVVRGEVSGNEDLLIQGKVDGSVALDLYSVTVGDGGRVKANISGRVITIAGDVEGDLTAQEQVVLRGSAKVLGDIKAPRVVLEDGASFRGLVDMGPPRESEKRSAGGAAVTGGAGVRSSEAAKAQTPGQGGAKEVAASAVRPGGERSGTSAPERRGGS